MALWNKLSWLKLAMGILIVFGSGVIVGIIGTVLMVEEMKKGAEDPEVGHAMVMRHLKGRLQLDEAQYEHVSMVMEEMIDEIVPIRDDARSQLAEAAMTHMPRIREVLNPEQEKRFEKFLDDLEKDWHVVLRVQPDSETANP